MAMLKLGQSVCRRSLALPVRALSTKREPRLVEYGKCMYIIERLVLLLLFYGRKKRHFSISPKGAEKNAVDDD